MSARTVKLHINLRQVNSAVRLWMFGVEHSADDKIGFIFADGSNVSKFVRETSWDNEKTIFKALTAVLAPEHIDGDLGLLGIIHHRDVPRNSNTSFVLIGLRKLRNAGLISNDIWSIWTQRLTRPPVPILLSKEDLSLAELDAAGLSRTDLWILTRYVSYLSAHGISTAYMTVLGLFVGSYGPPVSVTVWVGSDLAIKWFPTAASSMSGPGAAGPFNKLEYQAELLPSGSLCEAMLLVDLQTVLLTMDMSGVDLSTISTIRSSAQDLSAVPPAAEARLQGAAARTSAAGCPPPRTPKHSSVTPCPPPARLPSAQSRLTGPIVTGPAIADRAATRRWEALLCAAATTTTTAEGGPSTAGRLPTVNASGASPSGARSRRSPTSTDTERSNDSSPPPRGSNTPRKAAPRRPWS